MTRKSAFIAEYERAREQADAYLLARLPSYEAEGQRLLAEAMRYSVSAGGKRVRAVLMLAVCDLCGGDRNDILPYAAAVEYIHTYSLIHDDMPCMDDDDFRRGKPSCHKAFGEAVALLAGDALLNLAFETLLERAALDPRGRNAAEAAAYLARASGSAGMAGGQAIDLSARADDEERLTYLHSLKTGRMFNASVLVPAIYYGVRAEDRRALDEFGDLIGLAFQIKDDILDADEKEGVGYVYLFGREEAERKLAKAYADALARLERFGERAWFLRSIAQYITERAN